MPYESPWDGMLGGTPIVGGGPYDSVMDVTGIIPGGNGPYDSPASAIQEALSGPVVFPPLTEDTKLYIPANVDVLHYYEDFQENFAMALGPGGPGMWLTDAGPLGDGDWCIGMGGIGEYLLNTDTDNSDMRCIGPFAISFWFYPFIAGAGTDRMLFCAGNVGGGISDLYIYLESTRGSDAAVSIRAYRNGTPIIIVDVAPFASYVAYDQWNFLVLQREIDNTWSLQITNPADPTNMIVGATGSTSLSTGGDNDPPWEFSVGSDLSGANPFVGFVDNIRKDSAAVWPTGGGWNPLTGE